MPFYTQKPKVGKIVKPAIAQGKPRNQSIAIALDVARKEKPKKRYRLSEGGAMKF